MCITVNLLKHDFPLKLTIWVERATSKEAAIRNNDGEAVKIKI